MKNNVLQMADYRRILAEQPMVEDLPCFNIEFKGQYFVAYGIESDPSALLAAAADLRQAADILEAEARGESVKSEEIK